MRYLNKFIEYGVLLFVFLIPWQARWIVKGGEINSGYWEYGTRSLYATEVLLGLILAAVVIKIVSYWRPKADSISGIIHEILSAAQRAASRMTVASWALLLLLVWAGLAVFWSIDRGVALQHLVFLVLAAALFVILYYNVPSPFKGEGRVRVWSVIILSAALQGAIALIQFFSQSISGSTFLGMSAQSASALGASVVETVSGRWLRAYGAFPHPNILGGWLALGLIIWLAMTRWRSGIVKWSSFVVILSGLLVTFSRSAWLAFTIALFFIIATPHLMRGKRAWQSHRLSTGFLAPLGMTLCVVAIFAALFPEPFLSRLSSNNRLEIKSTEERTASLSQGWQIIKKDPLTGVGLGNYGLAVYQYLDNTKPAWYYQPTHNVPLLIWSELGLIGFLLITFYLLLFTFKARKGRFRFGLYLLPLLTLSLFDHYFWSLYSGMIILAVWLVLAKKYTYSSSDY